MPFRTVRLIAVTLLVPATLAAQAGAPARPDFKSLRFDESWSASHRSPRLDDAIKAIPLAPWLSLTVGGQARWRDEWVSAFQLDDRNDTYGQSRVQLHADLQAGDRKGLNGRLFVEMRDAQSYGRDLPGGTRVSDADRTDAQNLFVDVGHGRSFVRLGRQEVVTNRERLIGVPDWSNTRRGFEGVRAVLVRGPFALDVLDARPVQVRIAEANRPDSTARLAGAGFGSAPGAKPLVRGLPATWQVYRYEQHIAAASVTHRITTGARALWALPAASKASPVFSVELEGAVQRGRAGARALEAWFAVAEVQAQWRAVRGAPSLALGTDLASGDADGTDATATAFNMLYTAAHAHGGYADVIGRANARETRLVGNWSPLAALSVRGAWHRWDRLTLADGAYTKQNTVLRAASGSRARHVADELDLTLQYNATRHLRLIAGHAWVLPGAFLADTPGGALAERWAFFGTTLTF